MIFQDLMLLFFGPSSYNKQKKGKLPDRKKESIIGQRKRSSDRHDLTDTDPRTISVNRVEVVDRLRKIDFQSPDCARVFIMYCSQISYFHHTQGASTTLLQILFVPT